MGEAPRQPLLPVEKAFEKKHVFGPRTLVRT
jgi:hypothetical protein